MQFQPILSSLRHHKLTALLLTLQVAVTCAIVCNVVFMIVDRIGQITLPTGLDESSLSIVQVNGIGKDGNPAARHAADLATLRALPGVSAAIAVDALPLTRSDSSYGMCASSEAMDKVIAARSMQGNQGCLQPSVYSGTPGEVAALGLKLVEGRDFLPGEYLQADKGWNIAHVSSAIISRELAQRMFHGQSALGQSLYPGDGHPMRIVGIVETLL
ncbi:MAG TPA: ABC transporter permease, partial [Rhodanobacter sp.]